jgi:hypothetical protein
LQQNYPNPFNSATQIRFELDREGPVELAVFNLTGQRVATLVRGAWPAGRYAVPWDGGGLGSGSTCIGCGLMRALRPASCCSCVS